MLNIWDGFCRMYSIWNCLKGLWKLWWISVHFLQPGLGVKIPLHIAPSKPLRIKASPLSFYPGECSSFPLIHVWWQLWMWRPLPFSPYSTKSRRQPWQIIHTRHLHHLLKFTHFHKDSLDFFRLFYHSSVPVSRHLYVEIRWESHYFTPK